LTLPEPGRHRKRFELPRRIRTLRTRRCAAPRTSSLFNRSSEEALGFGHCRSWRACSEPGGLQSRSAHCATCRCHGETGCPGESDPGRPALSRGSRQAVECPGDVGTGAVARRPPPRPTSWPICAPHGSGRRGVSRLGSREGVNRSGAALVFSPRVCYPAWIVTGNELKEIRKRLGLTQPELADRIGVHWNTLARWERDEVPIRESMSRLIRSIAADPKKVK
jgi:DNA-binding XRE family transcriptional regulator